VPGPRLPPPFEHLSAQAIPTRLECGAHAIQYDLVVSTELHDPIGAAIVAGEWALSSALMWLLACLRPGDAVLDLGAHFGSFAIPAACLGAHVTAVEGSAANAAVLREACRHNALDNVVAVESVVTAGGGPVDFVDLGPYGTVATEEIGRSHGYPTVGVESQRVDDLTGGPFTWAKVDIEGLETSVLRGNSATFRNLRGMAIESNGYMLHQHGSSPADLVKAIEGVGMTVFEVYPGILRPLYHPVLQPETIVDDVAVRGNPPLPPGWEVSHGRGRQELLRRLEVESRHWIEEHRSYARRTKEELRRSLRRELKRLAEPEP
jgi:FkbM family methyltransferase